MGLKNRILVIDDDPAVAEILVNTLCVWGYRATSANDAMQAVIQAEGLKPGLVIMDIKMPNFGTGLEAYRKLRKIPELKDTPVIFMTGLDPDDARKLVPTDDPKVRLIFKPIALTILKQWICELIDKASPSGAPHTTRNPVPSYPLYV